MIRPLMRIAGPSVVDQHLLPLAVVSKQSSVTPFALKPVQDFAADASSQVAAPVYRGQFGRAQAERLLWRAGFGPRRGEADRLAQRGLDGAVRSLTRPARRALRASAARRQGSRSRPRDAYGHDHLWWLDRMVRTNRPLVERMTLVWHDWFATSNDGVNSQKLMLQQNALFRRNALGSFRELLARA